MSGGLCRHGALQGHCGACKSERIHSSGSPRDSVAPQKLHVKLRNTFDPFSDATHYRQGVWEDPPYNPSGPSPGGSRGITQPNVGVRDLAYIPPPPQFSEEYSMNAPPKTPREVLLAREMLRVAGVDPSTQLSSEDAYAKASLIFATAPMTGGITLREFNDRQQRMQTLSDERKEYLGVPKGLKKGGDGDSKETPETDPPVQSPQRRERTVPETVALPPAEDVDLLEPTPKVIGAHDGPENDAAYHILGDMIGGERVLVPIESYTDVNEDTLRSGAPPMHEAGELSHVHVPPQSIHHAPPKIRISCKPHDRVLMHQKQSHHVHYPQYLKVEYPDLPRKAKKEDGEAKPPEEPDPSGGKKKKKGGGVVEDVLRLATIPSFCACGLPADTYYDRGPRSWLCANCGNQGVRDRVALSPSDPLWGCVNTEVCKWGLCTLCHGIPIRKNGHPMWKSRRNVLFASEDGFWRLSPLGEELKETHIPVGNEPEIHTHIKVRLQLDDNFVPEPLKAVYPDYEIHPRHMVPIRLYGIEGVNRSVTIAKKRKGKGDDPSSWKTVVKPSTGAQAHHITSSDKVDKIILDHFCESFPVHMTFTFKNSYGMCPCGGTVTYEHTAIDLDRRVLCDMCSNQVKRPNFSMCEKCSHLICRDCVEQPDYSAFLEVEVEGGRGLGGIFLLRGTTVISSVKLASPAELAGVKKGQQLTHINGMEVFSDRDVTFLYNEEKEKRYIDVNVVFRNTSSTLMTSNDPIAGEDSFPFDVPSGGWRLYGNDPNSDCKITEHEGVLTEGMNGLIDIDDLPAEGSPAAKDNTAIMLDNECFDIDDLFTRLDLPAEPSPTKKKKKQKEDPPLPPAEADGEGEAKKEDPGGEGEGEGKKKKKKKNPDGEGEKTEDIPSGGDPPEVPKKSKKKKGDADPEGEEKQPVKGDVNLEGADASDTPQKSKKKKKEAPDGEPDDGGKKSQKKAADEGADGPASEAPKSKKKKIPLLADGADDAVTDEIAKAKRADTKDSPDLTSKKKKKPPPPPPEE